MQRTSTLFRLLGDITLNPAGHEHEWFQAARADPLAPERAFYYFDDAIPGGYESWLGHLTLPKLDWQSAEGAAQVVEEVGRRAEVAVAEGALLRTVMTVAQIFRADARHQPGSWRLGRLGAVGVGRRVGVLEMVQRLACGVGQGPSAGRQACWRPRAPG